MLPTDTPRPWRSRVLLTAAFPAPMGARSCIPALSGVVITGLLPNPVEHRGADGEQPTVFNGVERLPTASN